jgi:hypothetical protein
LNVIEAVQKLRTDGGKIRRPIWPPGAWVTSDKADYYFEYHEPVYPGGPSVGRARGAPTPTDILATDWVWEPGKP